MINYCLTINQITRFSVFSWIKGSYAIPLMTWFVTIGLIVILRCSFVRSLCIPALFWSNFFFFSFLFYFLSSPPRDHHKMHHKKQTNTLCINILIIHIHIYIEGVASYDLTNMIKWLGVTCADFFLCFLFFSPVLEAGGWKKNIQNETSSSLTHKIQKCIDIKEGVFFIRGQTSHCLVTWHIMLTFYLVA